MRIGNIIEDITGLDPGVVDEQAAILPSKMAQSMYKKAMVEVIRKLDVSGVMPGDVSDSQRKKLETLEMDINKAVDDNDEHGFRITIREWQQIYSSTVKNKFLEQKQPNDWLSDEPHIKCVIPVEGCPKFKRKVYPSVCKYHREMKDQRCSKQRCPRFKINT